MRQRRKLRDGRDSILEQKRLWELNDMGEGMVYAESALHPGRFRVVKEGQQLQLSAGGQHKHTSNEVYNMDNTRSSSGGSRSGPLTG